MTRHPYALRRSAARRLPPLEHLGTSDPDLDPRPRTEADSNRPDSWQPACATACCRLGIPELIGLGRLGCARCGQAPALESREAPAC